jgi:hypothetical protein
MQAAAIPFNSRRSMPFRIGRAAPYPVFERRLRSGPTLSPFCWRSPPREEPSTAPKPSAADAAETALPRKASPVPELRGPPFRRGGETRNGGRRGDPRSKPSPERSVPRLRTSGTLRARPPPSRASARIRGGRRGKRGKRGGCGYAQRQIPQKISKGSDRSDHRSFGGQGRGKKGFLRRSRGSPDRCKTVPGCSDPTPDRIRPKKRIGAEASDPGEAARKART